MNWVVTGANRGIGLALVSQIAARGDRVFAACRSASKELEALGKNVTVVSGVDVTSPEAADAIKKALGGESIDVLLHNAGILERNGIENLDVESVRRQFEVNALGPIRLTSALLDRLKKGSKIAVVSSRVGSIADNGSGGHYGYRMSKAALNMGAMSLTRDLAPRGIAVVVLHPGYVKTGMTGGSGNEDPETAAKGLLGHIDRLTLENSGKFWHANGQELPW